MIVAGVLEMPSHFLFSALGITITNALTQRIMTVGR